MHKDALTAYLDARPPSMFWPSFCGTVEAWAFQRAAPTVQVPLWYSVCLKSVLFLWAAHLRLQPPPLLSSRATRPAELVHIMQRFRKISNGFK